MSFLSVIKNKFFFKFFFKKLGDNVKFLENEITKLADQILNKNLKLTEEQKRFVKK